MNAADAEKEGLRHRAVHLSEMYTAELEDLAEKCIESKKWKSIGTSFEESHGFSISYTKLRARDPNGDEEDLCKALFHDLAERGISIAELASVLDSPRIGLVDLAKKLRTTAYKNKKNPRQLNDTNNNNNYVNVAESNNYKPSSVTKFLMVPNDDLNLSTSVDVVLKTFDFELIHQCDVYVIWKNKIHDEKTDCSRYVLKFFVGNEQIYTKTSDALKHANEVLFLLTKNVQHNNYITINNDNDIEAYSQIPVSTCLSLLRDTLMDLKEHLKKEVPYAFYGVTSHSLPSLKHDKGFLRWMTGTTRAVVGRSYFCFKFHNNGQETKQVGPEVTDTVTVRTIEGEFEGLAIQSINVYISGTTLLPVMIQLHKEDIYYDLLAKHSLRLISINEVCVQDVEEVLKDPRNEVYRADLEAMIERMKREGVCQTFDERSNRIKHSFGTIYYTPRNLMAQPDKASKNLIDLSQREQDLVRLKDDPSLLNSLFPGISLSDIYHFLLADNARIEKIFPEFRIEKMKGLVGSSPFVEVKLNGHDEVFAVKFLGGSSPENTKSLIKELIAMRFLQHENLLRCEGFTRVNNEFSIVMKKMDNNLFSILLQDPGLVTKLEILLKIAKGIAHLHFNDVVHMDLKPQNILLSNDYKEVVVTDFGIAHFSSDGNIEVANALKTIIAYSPSMEETINYMAPDLYEALVRKRKGDVPHTSAQVTSGADVYSFGAIMLMVFRKETGGQRHSNRSEPFLMNRNDIGDTPPALIDLIEECLSIDPVKRPAMNVVVDKLEHIIADVSAQISAKFPNNYEAIKVLNETLMWKLDENLHYNYQELFRRLNLSSTEAATAHSEWPGSEVVALLKLLMNKEGISGMHRFYVLLQELEQTASLELIDNSPAVTLFKKPVINPEQQSSEKTDDAGVH